MLRSLWLRIRKRRRLERDLQDELAYHMEMRRSQARAPFGNSTLIRENIRDMWTFRYLENIWRDARHAVRVFRRTPAHTAAMVLLLALGIGANAAIFSLMYAVLFRELPVENPKELVSLTRVNDAASRVFQGISVPLYEDFRMKSTSFSGVVAVGGTGNVPVAIEGSDFPLDGIAGGIASGNYFQVLGIRPALGRVFTAEDDHFSDPHAVVVLSHDFWQNQFGGNASVLGQRLYISGNPFEIIGVAAKTWGRNAGQAASFWLPLNMQPVARLGGDLRKNRGSAWLNMIGRLKPGTSIRQAQAEATILLTQIDGGQNDAPPSRMLVEAAGRGLNALRQQYAAPLQMLMIVAVLLLLVACTNVASLLLARAGARQREIAVRQAIGCGRAGLVRQFFVESLMLAGAGGILGLGFAPWSSQALVAFASAGSPIVIDTSLDRNVVLFGATISFLSALLFGLVPALRGSQNAIEPALKGTSRSITGRQLLNRSLVAIQVAFSVLLVAASVLFARSLYRLYTMDPGFDRRQVITLTVDGRASGYQTPQQYGALASRIVERVSALPGVRWASVATCGLLAGCSRGTGNYTVEGRSYTVPENPNLQFNEVSHNFFKALGVPLVAGRGFEPQDRAGAPLVAVVNESFVRYYFNGQNPLGKRFSTGRDGERELIEIVGVVRDSKYNNLRDEPAALAFLAFEQLPSRFNQVLLKIEGPPSAVLSALRPAIQEIDPKIRLNRIQTLDQSLDQTLSRDILLARLTALFGALALILACFGVYGVISYLVVSRTTEIGIRLAIGAQPGQVLRKVIGDALTTVAPGVVLGIGIAVGSERFIASLLYGFKARDPLTYGAVASCLVLTTALAAYLPARRASKIDPVDALRCE